MAQVFVSPAKQVSSPLRASLDTRALDVQTPPDVMVALNPVAGVESFLARS